MRVREFQWSWLSLIHPEETLLSAAAECLKYGRIRQTKAGTAGVGVGDLQAGEPWGKSWPISTASSTIAPAGTQRRPRLRAQAHRQLFPHSQASLRNTSP